jgi:hypothetical protein
VNLVRSCRNAAIDLSTYDIDSSIQAGELAVDNSPPHLKRSP